MHGATNDKKKGKRANFNSFAQNILASHLMVIKLVRVEMVIV